MGRRRRLIISCKSPRDGSALPETSSSVDCLFGVYWGHLLDYVLDLPYPGKEVGASCPLLRFPLCNSRELNDSEVCV
jgi:hypothetical protein